MGPIRRWIILYLQSTRVSVPSSELAPPAPSPASKCVPPFWNQRGEQHPLAGEGLGGANSDDWRESLALCGLHMYSMGPFITLKYILYFILVHNVLNILFEKCAWTVDEPPEAKIRNKEVNFARASGQWRAKSPVFCKHVARTIIWIKKKDAI
jgi:hypothetical protein